MRVGSSYSKTLYYHSDGTGRDRYIGTNSGGFFAKHEVLPELPVTRLFARRSPVKLPIQGSLKQVRYVSNGTGRDMYIATSSGGFEYCGRPKNKTTFASMLRVYDNSPTTMTQTFTVMDFKTRMQYASRAKDQRVMTVRLSAPTRRI
jgi:hypothetical protein